MRPSLMVGAPLGLRLATGPLWIFDEKALRPKTGPHPSLWICDVQALRPINRAATVRERRND